MPERFNEQFSVFVNTALKEYEQERGIQIRYVPKIHPETYPLSSESISLRLEEITKQSRFSQSVHLSLLDQHGKPLFLGTKLPNSAEERIETGRSLGVDVAQSVFVQHLDRALLVNFVRDEAEGFKRGEVTHISSNEELRRQFGYSNASSFYRLLGREGLIQERKRLIMERGRERLMPSPDLAWMLGILAGGGYVMPENGAIGFTGREEHLLEAFKTTAEGLFNTNVFISSDEKNKGDEEKRYQRAHFHSTSIARALGDLRRNQWPQTLTEKHSWILDNPSYIWKFLNGFFEVRGHITSRGIIFTSSYLDIGNTLIDLLTRVGIDNPRFQAKGRTIKEIQGVGLHNLRDQKLFAQNISSKIPLKEQRLDHYRKKEISVNTRGDFIEEWKRLKKLLGHLPNSSEILELGRQGQTRFHYTSYSNRFGKGSYKKASEYLEKVISGEEQ